MRWEFTPDEFMYVWQVTGRDRYPFPLSPVSVVRRESEYAALAAELTRRYPAGADPDLDAALRVAADPAITLAAFGTRNGPIRAYGAVDTTVGVVLAQRPEPGGNVVVCAGTPAVVASMFCAGCCGHPGTAPVISRPGTGYATRVRSRRATSAGSTSAATAATRIGRSTAISASTRYRLRPSNVSSRN